VHGVVGADFSRLDIVTGHSKAIRARNSWEGETLSCLRGTEHDMRDRGYVLLVGLSSGMLKYS
jgi:hypothetical protein